MDWFSLKVDTHLAFLKNPSTHTHSKFFHRRLKATNRNFNTPE